RGISVLAEVARRDSDAKDDILGIDRQFAHRGYLRAEDGYHPSEFKNSGLYGKGLKLFLDVGACGYDGDFDQKSQYLQSRCMTRFMSDNSCNTANNFFIGGPAFGSFPTKVYALANAKMAYSATALASQIVPVAGQMALIQDFV